MTTPPLSTSNGSKQNPDPRAEKTMHSELFGYTTLKLQCMIEAKHHII
jgi:hypothetical protein